METLWRDKVCCNLAANTKFDGPHSKLCIDCYRWLLERCVSTMEMVVS